MFEGQSGDIFRKCKATRVHFDEPIQELVEGKSSREHGNLLLAGEDPAAQRFPYLSDRSIDRSIYLSLEMPWLNKYIYIYIYLSTYVSI